MILVLLGTQHNEFTRLLKEIEECIENKLINEEVIVQELEEYINNANIIITHGGVGSIVMAIEKDKKVIAVPRLHEYGEHVNDHQKQIIKAFSEKKYLIGIQNVDELPSALKEIEKFKPEKYKSDNKKILNIIENFIDNI